MELLDFIFRLGVVFAIYGFLWGLFELGLMLLSAGRKRTIGEIYLIKGIKYVLLADVTFLFCVNAEKSNMVIINQVVFAGFILLTYYIGKLQRTQNQSIFMNFGGNGISKRTNQFSFNLEIVIISLSLLLFTALWFYPSYAYNPLSEWFHESILNIEDTPVFGFIFKVIGFFFLLSLIFKMIGAFTFILNGGAVSQPPSNDQNDDHFDDFEEIT